MTALYFDNDQLLFMNFLTAGIIWNIYWKKKKKVFKKMYKIKTKPSNIYQFVYVCACLCVDMHNFYVNFSMFLWGGHIFFHTTSHYLSWADNLSFRFSVLSWVFTISVHVFLASHIFFLFSKFLLTGSFDASFHSWYLPCTSQIYTSAVTCTLYTISLIVFYSQLIWTPTLIHTNTTQGNAHFISFL